MQTLAIALIAAVLFALLFGLERVCPLRKGTRSLLGRLVVNVAVSALTFLAAATLVQPATHWALHLSASKPFGLIHLVTLPSWLELTLSFLLMDLAFYFWHLAIHRASFLFRLFIFHLTDSALG